MNTTRRTSQIRCSKSDNPTGFNKPYLSITATSTFLPFLSINHARRAFEASFPMLSFCRTLSQLRVCYIPRTKNRTSLDFHFPPSPDVYSTACFPFPSVSHRPTILQATQYHRPLACQHSVGLRRSRADSRMNWPAEIEVFRERGASMRGRAPKSRGELRWTGVHERTENNAERNDVADSQNGGV